MADPWISTDDLGSGYAFQKADTSLFAVYQTLYSRADTEQWYDWEMRLNDTKWSENCYFLTQNRQKLGGVIVEENRFLFPFLVYPFSDRRLFYLLLHKALCSRLFPTWPEIVARNGLDEDVEVLVTMGYIRSKRSRRVMIRPTDRFDVVLPEGFRLAVPQMSDAVEITEMLNLSFHNGIDEAVFGPTTMESVVSSIQSSLTTGTEEVSSLIYHGDKLVGACLAGVDANAVNGFAGIGELAVVPDYRGQGLGSLMLKLALNNAYPYSPAMRLVVTVGNPAESLYHRLGFLPGPRFSELTFPLPTASR